MNSNESSSPIDPQVRIGHVHLKVADLERSLGFYCGVLAMFTRRLDLNDLLQEVASANDAPNVDEGPRDNGMTGG